MLKQIMEKVLIVGAGPTGTSIAALLRQEFKEALSISVWDKSRGVGGRMSTSRSNTDSKCTVDLGAQYITVSPTYQQKHKQIYEGLLGAEVLRPLTATIEGYKDNIEGTKNYVAPNGISSIAKHYMNVSGASLGREQLVKDVSISDNKVKVTTDKGHCELFDSVVITMPVAQILQLQGDIQRLIDEKGIRSDLEGISYSSRFCVGLFYNKGTNLDYPWGAKYVTDDPCVRYISIDNKKRGQELTDCGPSMCIHASVPWSLPRIEMDKDEAAKEIMKYVNALLPGLPEPVEVKGHKWRYSQVYKAYKGTPGCVVLSDKPSIILAGDAFTARPAFDGCLDSSTAVRDKINTIWMKNGNL